MAIGMPDESDPGMSAGGGKDISGAKTTMKVMGDIALVVIPGGGIIRIGRVGSKMASAALKRLQKAFGNKNVKTIEKPTAAQVKKSQPTSTVLKADGTPKANVTLKSPQQVATNRLAGQGARVRQQRRKHGTTLQLLKNPTETSTGSEKNRRRVDNKPMAQANVVYRQLADDVKLLTKRAASSMRQAQKRAATKENS